MYVWICSYLSCKSDFVFLNGISSQHLELRLAVCCVLCNVVVVGCGQGSISDLNNPPTRRNWMLRLQGTCKNTHTYKHALGFLPAAFLVFSLFCVISPSHRTPISIFLLSRSAEQKSQGRVMTRADRSLTDLEITRRGCRGPFATEVCCCNA